MIRRFVVTTTSGSEYVVEGNGTEFRYLALSKQAAPDPVFNVKVVGDYDLDKVSPWPPEVNRPLLMVTKHLDDINHPDRMPGGGKITSPVVKVDEVHFE